MAMPDATSNSFIASNHAATYANVLMSFIIIVLVGMSLNEIREIRREMITKPKTASAATVLQANFFSGRRIVTECHQGIVFNEHDPQGRQQPPGQLHTPAPSRTYSGRQT